MLRAEAGEEGARYDLCDVAGAPRPAAFTAAAEAMWRIVVNHARDRERLKRAGGRVRLELLGHVGAVADDPDPPFPANSSVQARMRAMSLRAFGAMMTSIFLHAVLRCLRPDFGFNIRDESIDLLLALQDDALPLTDFIEPLFGCLSKRMEFRLPFLLLLFEKAQCVADDFAGVAVAPRGDLTCDKVVQMFGQIDVACWYDRLLSLPYYHDWQSLPIERRPT